MKSRWTNDLVLFFHSCRCWTVCFLAGGLLCIMLCGEGLACEVHTVELYVADNEVDAQDTLSTAISICDCNEYWVRVRWRARESSGPGDHPIDGPFDIEVYEGGTKIAWKYDIADVDPGWQQEVIEITHPSALTPGTHTIKARARRQGSGGWKWSSNQCTVTVKKCTQDYNYAYAKKYDPNVIGVVGTIRTRYGDLCCEPFGTAAAFSIAYVDIDFNAPPLKWGQTGYGQERYAGSTTIYNYRYWEIMGTGTTPSYKYDYDNAPSEGSFPHYCAELDNSTGEWTFYYDLVAWDSNTDTFWVGKTCDRALWSGEIYNVEDDMVGTSSNKCYFANCGYKKIGGTYQSAGLTVADVNSSDANQWGAQYVAPTLFNIWDIIPGQ